MDAAALAVVAAGPHVSLQDAGRRGATRYGVPPSGPMDEVAHRVANVAVGNPPDATAIELSQGGLVLECRRGAVTVAVAGGGFVVGGSGDDGWLVRTLRVGEVLEVRPGDWGSWAYVAVAGEIAATTWLGSTATHPPFGRGGRVLAAGDELEVRAPRVDPLLEGPLPVPQFAQPVGRYQVVLGPQADHFEPAAVDALLASGFRVTSAYDRQGVRLEGPELALRGGLSIPSEPMVVGSIQVAGDGVATVLLADHQTTGGYPKIAVVVSAQLAQFAQQRPGDVVRFEAVSAANALAATRRRIDERASHLDSVARRSPTLDARLRHHNLISWGDDSDVRIEEP